MFTQSGANSLVFIMKWLHVLGAVPFQIDKTTGRATLHFWSQFRVLHVWIWFTVYTFVIVPQNFYELYKIGKMDNIVFGIVICLIGVCSSVIFAIIALHPQAMCQAFNGTYKFMSNFEELYINSQDYEKYRKRNIFIERLSILSFVVVSGASIFPFIDSLIHPQSPIYFLIGVNTQYMSWKIILFASLWFSYETLVFTSIFGFVVCNGILYFAYVLLLIRNELRLGGKHYVTKSCLRLQPNLLVVAWRSVDLLVRTLNREFFFCLVFIQGLLTSIVIFSVVTLTLQWNSLGIIVKLMLIAIAGCIVFAYSLFLILAGYQHRCSLVTIRSWKRKFWSISKDGKYMEKVKRSCKPLCFGDGSKYVIRAHTVLLFLRSVSKNTSRALVTCGKIFGYD